jgi:hypothetical protein
MILPYFFRPTVRLREGKRRSDLLPKLLITKEEAGPLKHFPSYRPSLSRKQLRAFMQSFYKSAQFS